MPKRTDYLLRNYGLTFDQYQRLLKAQGGVCCICGAAESKGRRKALEVEHEHGTNRVRGIACHSCNMAIMQYENARASEYYDKVVKYVEGRR